MPGFVTHHLFGVDLYHGLENSTIKTILKQHKDAYKLGLQGPDLFLYHLPWVRGQGKDNPGGYLHKVSTGSFIRDLIRETNHLHRSEERDVCIAYIAGYLGHYQLDRICHPFIYSRIHYPLEVTDYTYYVAHARLETEIDRYLLFQKRRMCLTDFPYAKIFRLPAREEHVISSLLSKCLLKCDIPCPPAKVRLILWEARIESLLQKDASGIKDFLISLFEKHLHMEPVVSVKLITDQPYFIEDYLNSRHAKWTNPWEPDTGSRESMPELYNRCIEELLPVIRDLEHYFYRSTSYRSSHAREFLHGLGNYSMHSGLFTDPYA